MVIAVGTISTRGWAKTTKDKITELMNHYTEAGYSQSQIYRDNIKSYSFACAQYAQQPDLLASQVEADLKRLFGAVFPEGVQAEASYQFLDDNEIRYRIIISLRVMADGEWYDATRSVNVNKGEVGNV